MERSYRFAVLACVMALLTSCVGGLNTDKIDVNIEFRPVIGYDTRVDESVPFPEDRSFLLWAQASQSGQMYIDSETVSYDGVWRSAMIWPQEHINFSACWPLAVPVSYSVSEGLQIKGFDCAAGDVDVLIAKADSDDQVDGQVVLPFNHALSRIEFRMRHSLSEDMSVRVNRIVLKGFAQKGDYNTKAAGRWSCDDYSASRVIFDASEDGAKDVPSGEAIYLGEDFFVIPQVAAPLLEVSCEVRYAQSQWVPETSEIESLEIFWEPGKHYTYTLNLCMDKLQCTTGISSWNNRE